MHIFVWYTHLYSPAVPVGRKNKARRLMASTCQAVTESPLKCFLCYFNSKYQQRRYNRYSVCFGRNT